MARSTISADLYVTIFFNKRHACVLAVSRMLERPAHGPQGKTWVTCSWLHSLKSWSLLDSRGRSQGHYGLDVLAQTPWRGFVRSDIDTDLGHC
jgi:hypothetical protein